MCMVPPASTKLFGRSEFDLYSYTLSHHRYSKQLSYFKSEVVLMLTFVLCLRRVTHVIWLDFTTRVAKSIAV